MKNLSWASMTYLLVSITIVTSTHSAFGQERRLRNSIGASYSGLRAIPMDQYIGAGVEYRYMHRSWLGVQAQISDFPQLQESQQQTFGGAIVQGDAVVLVGHRWGKVTVLQESGFGVLRSHVYLGQPIGGSPLFSVRNYPNLLLGGFVDVSVSHRLSLTFEVRDNMAFIGPTVFFIPFSPGTVPVPGGKVNAPEGRAGFAFHF